LLERLRLLNEALPLVVELNDTVHFGLDVAVPAIRLDRFEVFTDELCVQHGLVPATGSQRYQDRRRRRTASQPVLTYALRSIRNLATGGGPFTASSGAAHTARHVCRRRFALAGRCGCS